MGLLGTGSWGGSCGMCGRQKLCAYSCGLFSCHIGSVLAMGVHAGAGGGLLRCQLEGSG